MLIGKEDNLVDKYREELNNFANLIAREETLKLTINNPLFPKAERNMVLSSLLDKLDLSKVMKSFILLLFDKGRIEFLDNINEFYQNLSDELNGIAHASITAANDLSDETLNKIKKALSEKTEKEVILDVKKDSSLIGGVVTKIGDLVLDGSIKTQLLKMSESF
jgi:F-type H+-transporting ATPase subunit delta